MANNILVIGGTGKTGRKVAQTLQAMGHHVRIGSRRAQPAFDWQEPSTWPAALAGMDNVYITFQPDLAVPGAKEAIEGLVMEAERAGVQKLVLLSGKGETEAERCEQLVKDSGLDYTILRASWFNQNFNESFFLDPILSGHIALPKPEAQVPYVDTDDLAEVAVAALLDDRHNGQIYQLTGPELLTFPQVMQKVAKATGRTLMFYPVSLDAYVTELEAAQVPADYVWLIRYLFTEVLGTPGNDEVTNDIERVLGRPPKDFDTYAHQTAATGIWNPVVA